MFTHLTPPLLLEVRVRQKIHEVPQGIRAEIQSSRSPIQREKVGKK
jgi:hypothetical protein